MMTFGKFVRQALQDLPASVADMARCTGIPVGTIYAMTNRESAAVNPIVFDKIIRFLGVEYKEVIEILEK